MSSTSAAHAGLKRTVQKEFITVLGPYLRLAKSHGQEDSFIERVYTLWFIRWPLKPSDHEDTDAMEDYKNSTKKRIKRELLWACACSNLMDPERTWEGYMSICEARYGIARNDAQQVVPDSGELYTSKKRTADECVDSDCVDARPVHARPRPLTKRRCIVAT